ncbi:Mur ligase family protein [Arsenicicoccus dermatophilus]|uniref:Mur ligase family protein n=1 Tax=Arsenicicoccus dermatophilus TaxID=1076331 RepID=UPI0039174AE6
MILDVVTWAAVAAALAAEDSRWLRVAQREHYEPGRDTAMARLWTEVKPENAVLLGAAAICIGAGLWSKPFTLVGLAAIAAWPLGLPVRGTTKALAWTDRMKRLSAVTVGLQLVLAAAAGLARGPYAAAVVALLAVPLVDLAMAIMRPVERRMAQKFVVEAQDKLRRMRPTVVAITGSYGKTSTKLYVNQLLSRSHAAVASPASFNNLMGLSRTVNDRLVPGTEVFVAEMGTYGPGEIRELCKVFPPTIAAITTIGEAHLERMKNRETIVAAKSEITEDAAVSVLNVDVPELAALADRLEGAKRVVRCSATAGAWADVVVAPEGDRWAVTVDGEHVTTVDGPPAGHPINLAVAVGIARALDVPAASLAPLMVDLPGAAHRAELQRDERGVAVIDDTYNSNPDGAASALRSARAAVGEGGRIYTITPGMVELGDQQAARNRSFAAAATAADDQVLAITGLTNRRALLAGAQGQPGEVRTYPSREAAAAEIMAQATAGDVVLFENDLPDHYA